jgi:hypothetical protein
MVEPGAYPAFGEQRLVAHVGHNGLLFHPDAIEAIVDWCELPRVDPPVDPEAPSNVRGEPDTR